MSLEMSVPVHLLVRLSLPVIRFFCPVNVTNRHFLGIILILFILSTVFSGMRFASDPVDFEMHFYIVDGKVFVPHAGISDTLASYGAYE